MPPHYPGAIRPPQTAVDEGRAQRPPASHVAHAPTAPLVHSSLLPHQSIAGCSHIPRWYSLLHDAPDPLRNVLGLGYPRQCASSAPLWSPGWLARLLSAGGAFCVSDACAESVPPWHGSRGPVALPRLCSVAPRQSPPDAAPWATA